MYIIFLLISLVSAQAMEIRSLKEITYTRDNTYCQIGKKKIEIQIRSEASRTEPKERHYGEFIFYYPEEQIKLLPLNQDKLHNYRLFEGQNTLCSKSYGYAVEKDKVAILFLKENRPFKDKLSFQIINTQTLEAESVIDTEYMSDQTEVATDGFLFRTYEPRQGLEMGKVKIKDLELTFQDRDFPLWVKYSNKTFEVSGTISFEKFQWKNYFKDQNDFFESSAWNETEKKFKNAVLYVAVNHELKKECILLSPVKTKILGNETGWRCN